MNIPINSTIKTSNTKNNKGSLDNSSNNKKIIRLINNTINLGIGSDVVDNDNIFIILYFIIRL